MSNVTPVLVHRTLAPRVFLAVLLVASLGVLLSGCGSTKVYTADKTIVYNGTLYNMGAVQRVSPRIDGQLPDGTSVAMKGMDKKQVEDLLKQHSQLVVSTVVEMDQQEMVYQRSRVEKYSQFGKMADRLDGAMKDINKFMADKKKTQLKLK